MHYILKLNTVDNVRQVIVRFLALLVVIKKLLYICIKKSRIMHFEELIKIVKERRDNLQVTQEYLAQLSGVGLRTLKQFESGRGNPTLQTLQKIADVLGLEVSLKLKDVTRKP
jgi:DNA-binding XRE family transcriptional regulator